jgi:hypothetical protein
MVVFSCFKFGYKTRRCFYIGDDSIFEFTDGSLVCISPIEEDYFFTALFYELMNLCGREVCASTNNSARINLNFVGNTKGYYFIADANDKLWKIFNAAIGPFKIDVLESFVFASGTYISLYRR